MSFLGRTLGRLDVALDLGTSEQRLWVPGRGLALDSATEESPIRRGLVVHAARAAARIRPRLRVARRFGLVRPRVLACVPSSMTTDDRASVSEACAAAGASSVSFVSAPLVAAIGAGVDVASRYAQAIADVGDGLTDFAVIREGALVATSAIDVGLGDVRLALRRGLARDCGLHLDDAEAERALAGMLTGMDRRAIEDAVGPVLRTIAAFVARSLRSLPEAVGSEVIETPLALTGGGAAFDVVVRRIADASGLEVRVAAAPSHAVIRGAAAIVEN